IESFLEQQRRTGHKREARSDQERVTPVAAMQEEPPTDKTRPKEPNPGKPADNRVRKSQFDKRKRVTGMVASPEGTVAGFCVSISSFQGEEKNHLDDLYAFTDQRGRFAADYLPGATRRETKDRRADASNTER
ncbi:MAG: hypothetical protein ABSG68_25545, partial [Thermoguttaceae bacterium]